MSAEPADLNGRAVRGRAVAAARGDAPFDILLKGGLVADVVTGELRQADVGLSGPLISSVHPPNSRGDAAAAHDVGGMILAPGLIDAHLHIESSMVTPATYGEWVLPRGVTTLVWDPHEFGNVWGIEGIKWALRQAAASPMRILPLAPSCVPSAPGMETAGADLDAGALGEVLSWPEIHGLAEVMDMQGVIARKNRMTDIVQAGLGSGKPVFGHARGLSGPNLNAYAAAGISSDHEITGAADLKSKIRTGLFIELRGSHDHLLPELAEALSEFQHLPQTVTLCTDDVFPDDLLNAGGLDDVLRRLIQYGMPPMHALRAATFNAAQRIGRSDLGIIAPGRRADITVFDSFPDLKAERVIFNGRPVPPFEPSCQADALPKTGGNGIGRLRPADFEIRSPHRRVRVATIDRPRFTEWGETEADVKGGRVIHPPGATLMAVINRHGAGAEPRLAFLREWGDWHGAFCTTVSHDSHNLTVFGSNPADMAAAANAVLAQGGGLSVAKGGQVMARLPLPVGGLVSDRPLSEVASRFTEVKAAMDQVVRWQPPYLVFKACFGASLACNPGPHLTDRGIADTLRDSILSTPVLGPC